MRSCQSSDSPKEMKVFMFIHQDISIYIIFCLRQGSQRHNCIHNHLLYILTIYRSRNVPLKVTKEESYKGECVFYKCGSPNKMKDCQLKQSGKDQRCNLRLAWNVEFKVKPSCRPRPGSWSCKASTLTPSGSWGGACRPLRPDILCHTCDIKITSALRYMFPSWRWDEGFTFGWGGRGNQRRKVGSDSCSAGREQT